MNLAAAFSTPIEFSPLDRTVMETVESLARYISNYGYPCRAFTPESLQKFTAFPEAKKREILAQLNTLIHVIVQNQVDNPIVDPNDHPEKGLIQKTLDFYGFEFRDDFWSVVDKEEIVEIYNQEEIQIFRTFNFFKTCAYSLMELLTNEWFVLWERPSIVIEKMFEISRACLNGEKTGIHSMNVVPRHILKEIYNPGHQENPISRSVLLDFGHICPIYRSGTSVIAGIAVTSKGRLMGVGAETDQIGFL